MRTKHEFSQEKTGNERASADGWFPTATLLTCVHAHSCSPVSSQCPKDLICPLDALALLLVPLM